MQLLELTSKIMKTTTEQLTQEQRDSLLTTLKNRFEHNANRHEGLDWNTIQIKLEANPDKLWTLHEMERTEGEPDVIGYNRNTDEYLFCDCSPETPKGRRSICYDQQALEARKLHKPVNSAINMATSMGIELLTEEQYRNLQQLGTFDLKTSTWIQTPAAIRKLGGALFCDRRYDTVFVYHNGADSYYAVRGFRGILRV